MTSQPCNGKSFVETPQKKVSTSQWSVILRTFYRQILSLLYSSFFFWNFRHRLARELLVSKYHIFILVHPIWGFNRRCSNVEHLQQTCVHGGCSDFCPTRTGSLSTFPAWPNRQSVFTPFSPSPFDLDFLTCFSAPESSLLENGRNQGRGRHPENARKSWQPFRIIWTWSKATNIEINMIYASCSFCMPFN